MTDWVSLFDAENTNPGSLEKGGVSPADDLLGDHSPPTFVEVDDPRAAFLSPSVGEPPAAIPPVDDAPLEGPCHPWCAIEDLEPECQDSPHARFAVQYASWIMWSESARRYGLCERRIQPCGQRDCSCGCCHGQLLYVPGPIAGIIEIMENGQKWDPSRYRRYHRDSIELVDRSDNWPQGNNSERSPWASDIEYQRIDATPDDCPLLPDWVRRELDTYGITPTRETTATDAIGKIFELYPELGYSVLSRSTRPDWVQRYFDENSLDLTWGSCAACRDEDGSTTDANGHRYVCWGTEETTVAGSSAGVLSTACCSGGTQSTACSCGPHVVQQTTTRTQDEPSNRLTICSTTPQDQITALMCAGYEIQFADPEPAIEICERQDLVTHNRGPVMPTAKIRPLETCAEHAQIDAEARPSFGGDNCPAWVVRYWQGRTVPFIARELTAMLACEIVKAREGKDCLLTGNLSRMVRGGVVANYDTKKSGRKDPKSETVTGIDMIDAWLANTNPHKLRRRARVLRPDDPRRGTSRSF